MPIHIVTWNLNKERSNYGQARREFLKHLDSYENISDPGLESVRFISTTQSADQVSTFLRQKMDANDRLLVTKLRKGDHQGWLGRKIWNWISSRLEYSI